MIFVGVDQIFVKLTIRNKAVPHLVESTSLGREGGHQGKEYLLETGKLALLDIKKLCHALETYK